MTDPIACLSRADGRTTWLFTHKSDALDWVRYLRGEGTRTTAPVGRTVAVLNEKHALWAIVLN